MVLDKLILSIFTGFIAAGFVWWAGSSLLLALAAYSLGGSVTLLILAILQVWPPKAPKTSPASDPQEHAA